MGLSAPWMERVKRDESPIPAPFGVRPKGWGLEHEVPTLTRAVRTLLVSTAWARSWILQIPQSKLRASLNFSLKTFITGSKDSKG